MGGMDVAVAVAVASDLGAEGMSIRRSASNAACVELRVCRSLVTMTGVPCRRYVDGLYDGRSV